MKYLDCDPDETGDEKEFLACFQEEEKVCGDSEPSFKSQKNKKLAWLLYKSVCITRGGGWGWQGGDSI